MWKFLRRRSTPLVTVLGIMMTFAQAQPMVGSSVKAPESVIARQSLRLSASGLPELVLQFQAPVSPNTLSTVPGDAVYVHGATFGADLSVFYRFDGRSWADDLNGIGLNVWGFDFAGYGKSERYPQNADRPVGRMSDAVAQLYRVIMAVRERNGNRPVSLVAHSWGASVAASYAGMYPHDVKGLVLFAPIMMRTPTGIPGQTAPQPPVYPLSLWAQYRRFVEDVPRGQAQVLSEAHFQEWGAAYLATDLHSSERMPSSVVTPFGPVADIGALWSGQPLYNPARITVPTLVIRGAWDSLCTDADAGHLIAQLGSADKADVKIDRATHLMLLESQRMELHKQVNVFLTRTMK